MQIPRESGTRFSLTEDLKTDPNYFFRIRLSYSITDRHHISALATPLRLDASGQVDQLIRFNEEKFPADTPLNARYRFDSYRLTYRHDVYHKEMKQLAKDTGSIFIPRLMEGIARNPSLKSDQIHPNPEGYRIIADRVYRAIKPYL